MNVVTRAMTTIIVKRAAAIDLGAFVLEGSITPEEFGNSATATFDRSLPDVQPGLSH